MLFHNYKARVLSVGRGNLIGSWPMDEHAGGVSIDASPEGNNGAYTGVVLNNAVGPDGRGSPRFGGAGDFNNFYSAGFNADFSGTAGTCLIWGKVFDVGVWTDTINRYLVRVYVDGNNVIYIKKDTGNNRLIYVYQGSGIIEPYVLATTTINWFSTAITWDTVADEVKFYFNGILKTTANTIGAFVGNILSTNAVFGAVGTTGTLCWNGWLDHGNIWNKALSETEMGILGKA